MHSKFLRFFQFNSRSETGPTFSSLHFPPLHIRSCIFRSCIFHPLFSVLHFPVLHFQFCIFRSRIFRSCIFLPWKFGPSFSSGVGRSLIYIVPHWSLIFQSCIFSRPRTPTSLLYVLQKPTFDQ